jgi:GNAT-family acetyltransferase (TIGR03103 family)
MSDENQTLVSSKLSHRWERKNAPTVTSWKDVAGQGDVGRANAVLDCGWGKLIFAHTFADLDDVVAELRREEPGKRDIALYLRDPHVLLSKAPNDLFLDPSHTYRLWLAGYRPSGETPSGFTVHRLQSLDDAKRVAEVHQKRHMAPVDPDFIWAHSKSRQMVFLVARGSSGDVLGTVMGIDHEEVFDDPEHGASLWSLAVDPQVAVPGVGEALVRTLVELFQARGRAYVDLSVLHDNIQAIALYEKLGFQRVPVFCVKNKNSFNEPLFASAEPEESLNPYAQLIVDEARRRGIGVEILDAEGGFFRLQFGGRAIVCRESLSELTTAVAMSRCDDKRVTSRLVQRSGLRVPEQMVASSDAEKNVAFLEKHESVVVKPRRGEQGRGVFVDVRDPGELAAAIEEAEALGGEALIEQCCEGTDLRVIVIDYRVVAAATRRPASVVGTGRHTVDQLIEKQSRRRAAATGGESHIPVDSETERCIKEQGYDGSSILPEGVTLAVRKTANLHTGGTIHDVTEELHPDVVDASERIARAINIPVTGLDFIVPRVDGPEYVFIEANERPGLANHEPQPTAERFVDLLFPGTARPSK